MKVYTFEKKNSGYIGIAFEMAVKDALHRKHADRLAPAGKADLNYNRKNYDTKQNGSVLHYNADWRMIQGSGRVVYATHISYNVVAETETHISISVDLGATDMWCVDRKQFLDFLLNTEGFCKVNASRGTLNIQTMWNYKKNAYHGRKGRILEAWLDNNKLTDDPIVEDIIEGFYASL